MCKWFLWAPAITMLPPARSQKFYDFGVVNMIKLLFMDPAFCKLRTTGRTSQADDFFGSEYARRINDATNEQLFMLENSPYDIGFDCGQMFSFKQHSFGLVVIRCVL